MSDFIIKGQDGKPVFVGKEDPNNTLAKPNKGSQIECPICHNMVDYLLGEDTRDGGKMGCEQDYVPGKVIEKSNTYDTNKEIL